MPQPVTIHRNGRGPRLFAWQVPPGGSVLPDSAQAVQSGTSDDRTLLIVHGAGEHSGRYVRHAEAAARRGWRVLGVDLRGHGCSEGDAVHIKRFDDYARDLRVVADASGLDWTRTAILAHSMGGLVTIRGVQRGYLEPAAIVLSNPLLRIRAHVPIWKLILGRICRQFHPRQRFKTTVQVSDLLDDAAARRRRLDDPLISRTLTAAWYFQVRQALRLAWRRPYDTPTLLVQAMLDRVVDPRAAVAWLRRDRTTATEGLFLPGRRHEVLHEPDGHEIAASALDWLETRLPATVAETHRRAA